MVLGSLEAWVPRNMPVREHATPCFELHAQFQGGSVWRFKDKKLDVQAGHAILVPPGITHHLEAFTEEQTHHFALGLLPEKFEPQVTGINLQMWYKPPKVFPISASMRETIHLFIRETTFKSPLRTVAMETIARMITIEIQRAIAEKKPVSENEVLHPTVAHARQLIDDHLEANWSTERLARTVRVSPRHLFTLFKKELRETPHDYLLRKRIDSASRLLCDTDLSVTDIAHDLGFSTSQNFATVFRQQTGHSPLAFRRQVKKASPADADPRP